MPTPQIIVEPSPPAPPDDTNTTTAGSVAPDPPFTSGGGASTHHPNMLSNAFPNSPINGSAVTADTTLIQMTDGYVKKRFNDLVMRGTCVIPAGKFADFTDAAGANAYWAFEQEFNRDYVGYGDMTPPSYDFKHAGEDAAAGDPINSFVPNLMSVPDMIITQQLPPGIKMTEWADDLSQRGSPPFWGPGTAASPDTTSTKLVDVDQGWTNTVAESEAGNEKTTLGTYLKGRSEMINKPTY
jgi:hypothetical protein